jgi:hypothetical protein
VPPKSTARCSRAGEPLGTHGLAGFPATHADHRGARWFGAKILVEGDDTVDLGLGQVQLLGHEIDGPGIDVAEDVLQLVKDRHQGTTFGAMPLEDGNGPLL